MNKRIDYDGDFVESTGTETCQDMSSQFLRIMGGTPEEKKILTCFMNYIKFFVKKRYEESYWQTEKPTEIIDISNEIVREH